MRPDSLCRWQVQVSVYCVWRIPAHLRCTQCSILLHLMDICFLPCISLWQISSQNCLCVVVRPGFVSTPPAFMRSSASHPAGPLAQKNSKSGLQCWGREVSTVINCCDSSTACRHCCLEPDVNMGTLSIN